MRLSFVALLFILCITVEGCAPFAPRSSPSVSSELPSQYTLYEGTRSLHIPWWKGFGSSELNHMMETALNQGFSIQQVRARLDQARAVAVQQGAALLPDIAVEAGASHTRQVQHPPGGKQVVTTRRHSLGILARYEIDLWGRITSVQEAARLATDAAREDLHAAFMSLSAQIATQWVELLLVRREQILVRSHIHTNTIYLKALELRFTNSLATALDVLQQRETLARSQAMLPALEAREKTLIHELAVLMGRAPGDDIGVSEDNLPEPLTMPALGIPAHLLANRPDVRAAGLRLEASQWEIARARAHRLPAITLSARTDCSSDQVKTLFDNWLVNLAAGLTGPIFDGQRRAAEVERTRAAYQERLAVYQQVVMEAVRDVENALVRIDKQQVYLGHLHQQLDLAQMTLQQARQRYQNGVITYLNVLTSLLKVQSLERTLIQGKGDLLLYQIGLNRALGGTWYHNLNTINSTSTNPQGQS